MSEKSGGTGTYNTHDSGARAHGARHLGGRDHTERATPLVPLLLAYPSYAEHSIVGGGRSGSDHSHSPLENQQLVTTLRCWEFMNDIPMMSFVETPYLVDVVAMDVIA